MSHKIQPIMIRKVFATLFLFGVSLISMAQVNFTANDEVRPYNGPFGYGTNLGYYEGWTDEELVNIAAGNSNEGVSGLGVNSIRPWLPEWFLDQWGYDIRETAFEHYENLGVKNNAAFIGYPAEWSREELEHCDGIRSPMFKNMWEPIWDEGKNGTPVNEENYYALYIYKTVKVYGFSVKFWEVLNEPDFDYVGNSSISKDDPKSWWNSNPEPCETGLRAPIKYYIRMLRITYEVVKSLDPEAYVSIAGLGYPSFLDAVLRQTDNPVDGSVTPEYPLTGGAYFDAMCYHAYPHFDGSMRYWSNAAGGFVYTRHSDSAADGVVNKKEGYEEVLFNYGYDGNKYPKKEWIITESNIPRKQFGEYIGSDEAQRNFIIKTLVGLQQKEIRQFHIFSLAETEEYNAAGNEFQVMGLYKKISNLPKYQQEATDMGIAFKSTSQLLKNKTYDAAQTAKLNLGNNIRGGAFKSGNGKYTYVLWATTKQDRSESASAKYSFPSGLVNTKLEFFNWDFGKTNIRGATNPTNISLTGSPLFLIPTETVVGIEDINQADFYKLSNHPNPVLNDSNITFILGQSEKISLHVYNLLGQRVKTLIDQTAFTKGAHNIKMNWENIDKGVYFIRLESGGKKGVIKVVAL